jgi:peroxiredoxin
LNPVRTLREAASAIYTKFMASARENETLTAGQHAPDFRLEDLAGGGEKTLGELLTHGPVFLAFFKISCPTCQYTLPYLERMFQGRAKGGAGMFAVSQDDAKATREFHQEFGITMPTLLDSARFGYPASNAYGLSHVPSMFFIEPDGNISWSSVGFVRKDLEALGEKLGAKPFQAADRVPEMKSG